MSAKYQDKDLAVVIGFTLGRPVPVHELFSALGMSRSTYYEQRDKGTLHSAANLLAVATHFNIDAVDLLVGYGHLQTSELIDFLEREGEVEADGADGVADPTRIATLKPVRKRAKVRINRPKARTDIPSM